MNTEFQISKEFVLPLFEEIFVVKERDFSIQYNSKGEGLQKLLFLIYNQSDEFLEIDENNLLETIVNKGLRKELNDVWIANIYRFPNPNLENILNFFQPAQVIVWGCENWIKEQSFQADLHKVFMYNGVEFLLASSLSSYLNDNSLKAKLWSALQRMFFN